MAQTLRKVLDILEGKKTGSSQLKAGSSAQN